MEHSAETVGHDPCSFSRPNQCLCTNISWFVDVLIDRKILECRVQLEFEVKKDGVKKMVSFDVILIRVSIIKWS